MDSKMKSKMLTGLQHIVDVTVVEMPHLIDTLVGVAIDEEEAADLKAYWISGGIS